MITNFKIFESSMKPTPIENNIYEHIRILEKYIRIINKESEEEKFASQYFTIIHNFLILEIGFDRYIPDEYVLNKTLPYVEKNVKTSEDVFDIFDEMYSTNSIIRCRVEKFDTIDIVKEYLKDKSYIYEYLLDQEKTVSNIELFLATRKYNI
jgi:hypothetical protein